MRRLLLEVERYCKPPLVVMQKFFLAFWWVTPPCITLSIVPPLKMVRLIFTIYQYCIQETRKGHPNESSLALPFCRLSPDRIRGTGLTFPGNPASRDSGGNTSCRLPWGFRWAKVTGALFCALGFRACPAEKAVFSGFFPLTDPRVRCNGL